MEEARSEARAEDRREVDEAMASLEEKIEEIKARELESVGGRIGGPRRAHAKRRAIRRNQ